MNKFKKLKEFQMQTRFLLILLSFLSMSVHGQDFNNIDLLALKKSEAEYLTGDKDLRVFLGTNIRYPGTSRFGVMVGVIKVDHINKTVSPIVLNSLGKAFDKEFSRVVKLTKKQWNYNDSLEVSYKTVIIEFDFDGKEYYVDYNLKPDFVLDKVVLKKYGVGSTITSDQELVETLNTSYKNKKYKAALKPLEELIRRNPFNETFYVMYINTLISLEKDASNAYWMLTGFLGHSEYIGQFDM